MPTFLSPEWVDGFNAALAGASFSLPEDGAGLAVADGPVTVAEDIHGGPEGDLRLLLHVDRGTLRLERVGLLPDAPAGTARGAEADVTVSLAYEDAVALSAGELSPAEALNRGRIRVRGDLTVLVAAHQLLAAARGATADLSAATTY